ncbi:phenylalanine--tRNA ligase beta subunit-related protein [candidate division KSB1 bacterium]
MKVSYNWLQTYFDKELPSPEEVEEKLTFHAFEIEEVKKVGEDTVIDVDVLPNRAHDCLSHRGIAKELSVILEIPLKEDVLRSEQKKVGVELPQSKTLSVEIENPLLCRRYTSAVIQGVKVGPSPDWLKDSLVAIGQQSINNVVDATNYVMFGLGQPLHAFDASQLEKKADKYSILVRSAKDGEKITVLTGEEYELANSNLLIVDGNSNSPIGIAGVKGGMAAGINEDTTDIIIESANFNPVHTRKTSQSLKLRTDASTRFENELSPEVAFYGLTEVVKLIQDLAGGEVEGYVDEYPRRQNIAYKSGVSDDEVNKLLGTNISQSDVENILSRFDFQYEKVRPLERVAEVAKSLDGAPYKYGASILYDAPDAFDCSSFVAYTFSRAGISLPRVTVDQYVYGEEVSEKDLLPGDVVFSIQQNTKAEESYQRVADGVEVTTQAVHYKTIEYMPGTDVPSGVSHCGIYLGDGQIVHAAGKSSAGKVVIESIAGNKNFANIVGYRRMTDDKERYVVEVPFERLDLRIKEDLIEEVGRIYGYTNVGEEIPQKDKEASVNKKYYYAEKIRNFLTSEGLTEVYTYSLRDSGELELENPLASDKNFVRSTLREGVKGSVSLNEKNTPVLGIEDIKVFEIGNVFVNDGEHTSVCIGVSKEDKEVEQSVKNLFSELGVKEVGEWKEGTYEFNLDEILELLSEPKEYDVESEDKSFSYKPFSLFPGALRDIAVWVPENHSSDEILSMITAEAGELLAQSNLFDEYKKDGRVSYAFKLVFQSQEKTLSDVEINEIMEKITDYLNSQEGFEVR